ncbi:pyruvate-formate lyase [Mycobacteroides abscessus subsp. abscessus]|nr:pyruvate-formate lyase [Mycobacteroides abscessus subsp. abscessus]
MQLFGVGVDGDDAFGADEGGAGDGRVTHAAAADDRDGVIAGHGAGVDGGADAGHDAAAQQAGDGGVGFGIDLGALAFVHEGLVGEGADAQGGGEFGTVGQRHLAGGVERVEAQVRAAPFAGAALAADRAPVEDDEVADLDVGDAVADRFDGAGGFVAEQEGVLVVDAAFAVGQVGMAHPAGDDVHDDFTGSGIGDDDVDQLDGLLLGPGNHTTHCLTHGYNLMPPGRVGMVSIQMSD